MASLTKFKYGAYTTDDGDARLTSHEITAAMTHRGNRWGEWHRLHVEIELQAASATALHASMVAFNAAFSQNDQTAVLLFPDGTETEHKLDQASPSNYSGNKVIRLSWDNDDAGQLVNARTARVTIAALFRNPDSAILAYHDEIRTTGDAESYVKWVGRPQDVPVPQTIFKSTIREIIQSGRIITLDTWAFGNIPQPILPNRPYFQGQEKKIKRTSPRWVGNNYIDYGVEWYYRMLVPENQQIPGITPYYDTTGPVVEFPYPWRN